ncbi:helix-turn-helix domain-containing protein [Turicibacter sanguinis]|uniref:helix-turn-helix domain-containing protein n=1 Tax=uncultured Turicibacter sp. TaxID=297316 RepID=UPI0012BC78C6|nr:helix-turn-helix transcriptional regulator [uncultured Turicibacter sp.]MTN45977.1 helix-turn-helix domain-containing protein [Turicibacter sanguinis]MTN51819.1 helix-turn-helix domain-containing protein [Turicibacter sanguinis]MTN53796.1 helix-turn-helix domain-containing protein [Turicibacter sanguinis]MTN58106.1 helix-turn-helix domain-containing protein [Turicibacter sanguinis]MTN61138.1 helix-turn-helix domain-containing protein [Turicibacter sanguinis]
MRTRLREIRKSLGLNQTEFAKCLGITQTSYSMIENGTRPLLDRHIKVVCSEFNINEQWLKHGIGEMYLSSPFEKEFIEIFESLTLDSQEYLTKMAKELLLTEEKLLSKNK